ncbi:MAG TPA: hypothetical protein PKI19_05355 [Elusimicrobiales bacterium]|nr:hypothetical protein [Elusimicrobiales bacterium]
MRFLFLIITATALAAAAAQPKTEKRLTGLEKRVAKVEKRVTALEKGKPAAPPAGSSAAAPAPAAPAVPAEPVAVYFIRKKQFVTKQNMGVTLYLEFENISRRRFNAFNGELVFKDETGAVIWTKPYGYSEPLSAGERISVELPVSSLQAKEYLKFLKVRDITVSFGRQEFYLGE